MRKNNWLTLLLICITPMIWAQDTVSLSYENYIYWVKKNHPIVKNTQWEKNIAQNNILKARANFDPTLRGKTGEKKIDQIFYYQQQDLQLQLPTWYGIDFNVELSQLQGNKLNNDETKGSLNSIEVNIPLARGLLYNKNRALVEQAKILNKMTTSEQELLKNEILLEANLLFWEWVKNHQILQINRKVLEINKKRLEFVKKTKELGERPAIDITEAQTQLQGYALKTQEAEINYQVSTILLSQFLWTDDGKNYPLPFTVKPTDELDLQFTQNYFLVIERLRNNGLNNHFNLAYYQQKEEFLKTERRLKWQQFLPKFDLSYRLFSKDFNQREVLPFFENNFQYGLKLEIPIFLREARADLENVKLKSLQNQETLKYKKQELLNKVTTYAMEMKNYLSMSDVTWELQQNFQQLLKAEETRFANGESSLFLINSRENKLLEVQEKLTELKSKAIKTYFKINWLENNTQP